MESRLCLHHLHLVLWVRRCHPDAYLLRFGIGIWDEATTATFLYEQAREQTYA
jgi:hypothetical protein